MVTGAGHSIGCWNFCTRCLWIIRAYCNSYWQWFGLIIYSCSASGLSSLHKQLFSTSPTVELKKKYLKYDIKKECYDCDDGDDHDNQSMADT